MEVKGETDPYFKGGVGPCRFYCQGPRVAFCLAWGGPLSCYCIMGEGHLGGCNC